MGIVDLSKEKINKAKNSSEVEKVIKNKYSLFNLSNEAAILTGYIKKEKIKPIIEFGDFIIEKALLLNNKMEISEYDDFNAIFDKDINKFYIHYSQEHINAKSDFNIKIDCIIPAGAILINCSNTITENKQNNVVTKVNMTENIKLDNDITYFVIIFPATKSIPYIRLYNNDNYNIMDFEDRNCIFNSYYSKVSIDSKEIKIISQAENIDMMKWNTPSESLLSRLPNESLKENEDGSIEYNNYDKGIKAIYDGFYTKYFYNDIYIPYIDIIDFKQDYHNEDLEFNYPSLSKCLTLIGIIDEDFESVKNIIKWYKISNYHLGVCGDNLKIFVKDDIVFTERIIPNYYRTDIGSSSKCYNLMDMKKDISMIFFSSITTVSENQSNVVYTDYTNLSFEKAYISHFKDKDILEDTFDIKYSSTFASFEINNIYYANDDFGYIKNLDSLIYYNNPDYVYTRGLFGELIKMNVFKEKEK